MIRYDEVQYAVAAYQRMQSYVTKRISPKAKILKSDRCGRW